MDEPLHHLVISEFYSLQHINLLIPTRRSATWILLLNLFLSPVSSFFNRRDFTFCCIMVPHRFFCRPRLRGPLTSARHNSFHKVLVLSSHYMIVSPQLGLLYFVIMPLPASFRWLPRVANDISVGL